MFLIPHLVHRGNNVGVIVARGAGWLIDSSFKTDTVKEMRGEVQKQEVNEAGGVNDRYNITVRLICLCVIETSFSTTCSC